MKTLNREKYRQSIVAMTENPIPLISIGQLLMAIKRRISDYEEYMLLDKVTNIYKANMSAGAKVVSKEEYLTEVKGYLEEFVSKTQDVFIKTVVSNILANN
ncbi:hypothetical protein [Bacillus toyonensis]|uniref:hypothetical protein n=1 Tax=Bacillus toyonensis TaxID=155322 RepID=UPI000BF31E75|nr:hypothetical protein [Bacillus toyonensis]PGF05308.1 hypothetical protein COM61_02540 [Bacillus toyonensis]